MSETSAAATDTGPRSTGPRRWRARSVAGRSLRRWLVDIVLLALGVVSVIFEPMSIAVHSVIGLAFVAAVGPHLWDRRRWIRGALTRLRHGQLRSAAYRRNVAEAILLGALAVVVTGSGLWDWLDVPTRIRYHAISGVLLIAIAGRHAWTRRRALLRWRGRRR